jgi:hypothetical protein
MEEGETAAGIPTAEDVGAQEEAVEEYDEGKAIEEGGDDGSGGGGGSGGGASYGAEYGAGPGAGAGGEVAGPGYGGGGSGPTDSFIEVSILNGA